jgi:hypothetical protein
MTVHCPSTRVIAAGGDTAMPFCTPLSAGDELVARAKAARAAYLASLFVRLGRWLKDALHSGLSLPVSATSQSIENGRRPN